MLSLGRYFNWANEMRSQFEKMRAQAGLWGIPPDRIGLWSVNTLRTFQFLSYWTAGLYVVVEGWKELGLHDEAVDRLLADDAKVDLLRRYRNGVFHYQRRFFDERFADLLAESEAVGPWFVELTDALNAAIFPLGSTSISDEPA